MSCWVGSTAVVLLLAAAPTPAAAIATLTAPAADLTAPVVGLATLLGWGLALWLLLTVLLTVGARTGGRLGRTSAAVLRRAAPRSLRQLAALAVGAGVVLGAATPAGAAPAVPASTASSARTDVSVAPPAEVAGAELPDLDWPLPRPAATGPTAPAAPSAPAPSPSAPRSGPASPQLVVVAPGDSLWTIAAAHLSGEPSAAEVAQTWPSWWSANREVIGDDPDLLHPGQQLVAPPTGP